jgi:dTDP-4-amino-4,6-dideoxygalactose transaminase
LAEILRSIRVHGQGSHKYDNVRLGITGRLDTIQAAVLLVKLQIFEKELTDRQRVAALYARAIRDAGLRLELPRSPEGMTSAYAQFSLLADNDADRAEFLDRLAARGIPTAIYYPKPLHLQPAFAYLGHKQGDFPVSEDLSSRIFSLPMHPYLDEQAIGSIVAALA